MAKDLRIFGARAVLEAIEAGEAPEKILVQQGLSGGLLNEVQQKARKQNIPLSFAPQKAFNKFASRNHQGVVAFLPAIQYLEYTELIDTVAAVEKSPLFLLLDGLTDVRNLGAIIRTAVCTGVHGLILPTQNSAPINADTVKTSAGAVFSLPIAKCPHLKDAIYYLQSSGVIIAAATEKSEESIYDQDLNQPLALLMGSEGKGIHPSLLKLADLQLKLPMVGSIASLNVSVACGAMLYEILRQKR